MRSPRIPPMEPPYAPRVAETLTKMMPPGWTLEPLRVFRTIARNQVIGERFRVLGTGILFKGSVEPADREIVIHRTTARCGSEYEWGVHVTFFARPLGLTDAQIAATVRGGPTDPAFTERQALLVRMSDELHDTSTVSDALWQELEQHWTAEQLIELLVTAGFYHIVSFLTNALRVEGEEWAERFPVRS